MTRSVVVAVLVALAACSHPPRTAPAPAASAFRPAETPLPGLVADAARLDQPTDSGRFDALGSLLRERGLPFEVQSFSSPRRSRDPRGRNVIVTLGSGPREIIVGAHYDAAGLPGGGLSRGMVDNAAAVAVLVRTAETLRQISLHSSVRFVFFDMEESGLVGSRHFVESLDKRRIAAMVNLDIAGYGRALIFGPAASPGNDALYRAAWRVCAEARVACVEFAQYPPSDDRSFQAAGIPNISLAVVPHAEAHQLWLMLNAGDDSGLREGFTPSILRTIHTPEDTADRLDPAAMTLAYNAVAQLVLRLDEALR